MKLAFTTLGCPDWSFEKILTEASAIGYEGIEIRGLGGKLHADEIVEFFPENQEKTLKLLNDFKIKVIGFGSSVSFHNAANYESALLEGKKTIDVCNRMEFPAVRVFGDIIEDAETRTAVIERIIQGIRELCGYAAGKNVMILLESHGNFNILENMTDVVNGVKDCESFGVLWDIGNTGEIYGPDWRDFYLPVKPYIKHTHVKDYRRIDGKLEYCLIGTGEVPVADIVKQLAADGYGGYYSLEWEKKWHPEIDNPEIAFPAFKKYMDSVK